nr:immunoglobulin heavy chain junction region [Macaca mulatta]MOY24143.1 immunoglobulin heavy chain junction region [Macaca mulatta]MOY26523.1 immunoglobulin heavy chain junction region [Macaca mulatta]MOY27296.1 immunoglobulin heavy chain junction region [Macaca mulatta]MOY29931.1 immunoglobulin heavy chain junction region [Macaca mulatta]
CAKVAYGSSLYW